MLTASEKEELDQLRCSAARFMTDPLEKAFFKLDSLLNSPHSNRLDSIMPTSAFHALAECVIELRREIMK